MPASTRSNPDRTGARIDEQGFVQYGVLEKLFCGLISAAIIALVTVSILNWKDNQLMTKEFDHIGRERAAIRSDVNQLRSEVHGDRTINKAAELSLAGQIIEVRIINTRLEAELKQLLKNNIE